jgi:hypothetical protein
MGKTRVPLRATRGIRALVPVLAGLFLAALPLLGAPLAGAEPARADPSESAVSSLEIQAEKIEAELSQMPGDEDLQANLTRTRIDVANAMITDGASRSKSGVDEIEQQLSFADIAWSKYLKVAKKPSPGLAVKVAPALFQLAELSSNGEEAMKHVRAAAAAQKIGAEGRSGKNSWTTLAFYDLFAQDYKAADKAIRKAITYANTKFERESIEKKFGEVEKKAKQFGTLLKRR